MFKFIDELRLSFFLFIYKIYKLNMDLSMSNFINYDLIL